ncbi:MAG TPA: hypothetical protein VMG58_00140 [Candidatus Sulfotelmatobacter sp.]|nr:hypothetical protein [Candidatus Sulfotelmatobacter sp.]
MTFRYGIAAMTEMPHVFLRVTGEFDDGRRQTGTAADNLPPKWFTKDPSRDFASEIDEMIGVIDHARHLALAMNPAPSLFAFWRSLWSQTEAWASANRIPPLLAHFGTSLVERAAIDAFCRSRGQTFASALRKNAFGIALGEIHAELAGSAPSDWLPARPAGRLFARHTVGLSDPLTEHEIAPSERLDDGLPQSLEASIAEYGLRHFKLKIGKSDGLSRLRDIAAVLARSAPPDFLVSLDGNEGFGSVAELVAFWGEVSRDPALSDIRKRLLFIEQPFHRDIALSDQIGELSQTWPERPQIVIDESDAELSSLPRALKLGYAGSTHKNCKGVFKGVANACLMAYHKRRDPDRRWSFTGEDLVNIGPVALLQDLAAQSALGVSSVERNGHHYFAGLSFWPRSLQRQVLAHHPDLYRASRDGWPTLRIEDGKLSAESVGAAPFGVGFEFRPEEAARPI